MLREWAYRYAYPASSHRTRALAGWTRWYNHHRPHGSLDGRPPISVAVLRRWWTWRTIDQDRAMRRLALWVLAMWTGIVILVSAYALVNPGQLSRIPAVFGIVAGAVGIATVWRCYRIQQEFYADPPSGRDSR